MRVVGPGRAGLSMAGALAGAGWQVEPPAGRGEDLRGAAEGVDLVVIATPDRVVAEVAAAITPVSPTVVAHLSGALGLDVLASHRRRATIHPLVPLPDPETGAARLASGVWFAVAGDPLADGVVAALGGRSVTVADEHRARHHAAAAIAANHVVALLGQVERVAGAAGLPLEAYLGLARAAVDDVARTGPAAALTGPVARGDAATVAHHLATLDPAERPSYLAVAGLAARLAATPRGPRRGTGGPAARQPDQIVREVGHLRALLDGARAAGLTVGLVPTMGALHEGHLSLVRRAAAECDVVAVSVFVNPLQFGPGEDLATYPRTLAADVAAATAAGATLVFAPAVAEMYPGPVATTVAMPGLDDVLEGASRPGHLSGVALVVAKLFSAAGPCRAYFGEKDWQQVLVVRRVAADLSFPVEVVGCPTVRDAGGLACSSRNARLTPAERHAAVALHRALTDAAALVDAGERDPDVVRRHLTAGMDAEPLVSVDYAAVVSGADLAPLARLQGDVRLLVAARVGATRLIDNRAVAVAATAPAPALTERSR
ncbi:MAG: pantoate--beta-alanine ligase [Acidimicrobiales bacterium]